MNRIIALLTIAISGCGKIKTAPIPPDWNPTTCEPSESTYVDMALDKQDRPPAIKPGTSAEQVHQDALAWIDSMGYELTIGRPPGYSAATEADQNFCGTTLPGHVYISQECFDSKGDDHMAWSRFLRHEGTHAAQQKRMGLYFFLVYAYGEGRLLAIEGPAYAEEYSTNLYFVNELPDEDIRVPSNGEIFESAGRIYDEYSGAHMPKQCYQQIAVRMWGSSDD